MITEDKVTEIFCMADGFCKFFDTMTVKYTLNPVKKRKVSSWFHDVKGRNYACHNSLSRLRLSLPEAFLSWKSIPSSSPSVSKSCFLQPSGRIGKGDSHTLNLVYQKGTFE